MISGPGDVAVRFTTAGDDAVVRAVQALTQQLQTVKPAADKATTSLDKLTGAGEALNKVLGPLGIALSIASVVAFTKHAIDAADAMNDLAKKTGLSVEKLSVLAFGAKQAGADVGDLNTSLRAFNKAIANAADGEADVRKAFAAVGVGAKELATLDAGDLLQLVANGLAALPDPARRAQVAMALFGKSGTDLLPLLSDLAGNGFANLNAKAAEAGAIIGTDAAKAADEFNDALSRLVSSVEGLARAVSSPLLGPLTTAIDKLTRLVALLQALPGFGASARTVLGALPGVGPLLNAGLALLSSGSSSPGLGAMAPGLQGHVGAHRTVSPVKGTERALSAAERLRLLSFSAPGESELFNFLTGLNTRASEAATALDKLIERLQKLTAARDERALTASIQGQFAGVTSADSFEARVSGATVEARVQAIQDAIDAQQQLNDTIRQTLQYDLAGYFGDVVTGAMSFGEAFHQVALSVIRDLTNIVSHLATNAFLGLFFNGIPAAPTDQIAVGPVLGMGKAAGGYIAGPGTATSDSIPAWLSNGEYVVRAAAVQAVGRDFLDAINYGGGLSLRRHGVRRFADGGLVGAGASVGGSFSAELGLEEGLVLRHLMSPAGEKAIIRVVNRNRLAVNAALERR